MRHRGFTIIEMMITVSVTATVMMAVVSLFGFAAVRLSDAYTQVVVTNQLNSVADSIEATIREAHSCRVSGTALVCSMPNAGTDTNQDGHLDSYDPSGVTSSNYATYTVGNYVWYYVAGSAGTYGTGTGYVWRAEPTTAANPTSYDTDSSYGFYYAGNKQFDLVSTLSVVVTSASRSVQFTVGANAAIGRTVQDSSGDSNTMRSPTVTRTVVWRNWR